MLYVLYYRVGYLFSSQLILFLEEMLLCFLLHLLTDVKQEQVSDGLVAPQPDVMAVL